MFFGGNFSIYSIIKLIWFDIQEEVLYTPIIKKEILIKKTNTVKTPEKKPPEDFIHIAVSLIPGFIKLLDGLSFVRSSILSNL